MALGGLVVVVFAAWLASAPRQPLVSVASNVVQPETRDPALASSSTAAPLRGASLRVSPIDAGDWAEQEARRIIADSRAAYAACDAYEDDGTYDLVFRGDAGFPQETEFHTAVAGRDSIRFAYRDRPDRFTEARFTQLIASDAGVVSYGPWGTEPKRMQSLDEAVGTLRGVSHGLTAEVLPLLPLGLSGVKNALDVAEPRISGTEEIDGTMCDVIEAVRPLASHSNPLHRRIWIAQSDSLIRRLTDDDVMTDEDTRRLNAGRPLISESIVVMMREAGVDESAIERLRAQAKKPLSTFSTVTFHPRCNEPVRPETLLATDASL